MTYTFGKPILVPNTPKPELPYKIVQMPGMRAGMIMVEPPPKLKARFWLSDPMHAIIKDGGGLSERFIFKNAKRF